MTTDGVLRDGQAGIQPQGREAGAAASPAGAMRTVLLGLVSVDALRVYVLRTLPPGALVDGRGELIAAHETTQAQLWEVA